MNPRENDMRGKYKILKKIDESTFSDIFLVETYCKNKLKFICKRIKNKKGYFDQSLFEVYILSYLKKYGCPQKNNFLHLLEFYYFNRRLHLMTENLGPSLYHAFIKNKQTLTLLSLQVIINDIITSLDYLKSVGIIHCDLKPENILLKSKEKNNCKLIDFGSAIFIDNNDEHYEMQTLPYRSPEIILESNYGYPIDMWSLGCIIYELITKKVLFNSENTKINLIKAMAINKTSNLKSFTIRNKNFASWKEGFPILEEKGNGEDIIQYVLPRADYQFENEILKHGGQPILVDFIKKCLILDPKYRMTPSEAKNHRFLKQFRH